MWFLSLKLVIGLMASFFWRIFEFNRLGLHTLVITVVYSVWLVIVLYIICLIWVFLWLIFYLYNIGKVSSYLCLEDEKPYHCSAVYAAALHSISLPFRMETLGPAMDSCYVSGAVDVYGLIQMLAGQARQNIVATLDAVMPAPSLTGIYLNGHLLHTLSYKHLVNCWRF